MNIKEIQDRNYDATVKRGLINDKTSAYDFEMKLLEEAGEVFCAETFELLQFELADVIIVCLNYAKHKNIDIQNALEQKTIFNENRTD